MDFEVEEGRVDSGGELDCCCWWNVSSRVPCRNLGDDEVDTELMLQDQWLAKVDGLERRRCFLVLSRG